MSTNQSPVPKPVEFRIKTSNEERMIVLDPNKLDSFKQMVADLRSFAQDEANEANRRYLLFVAKYVEDIALNLFSLDQDDEAIARTMEKLLVALAMIVNDNYFAMTAQQFSEYVLYGRLPQKNDPQK